MSEIENKMKTLEEIAEEFLIRQGCQRMCCNDPECNGVGDFFEDVQPKDLIEFTKWQSDKMYSEEDLRNAYRWGTTVNHGTKEHFNEWFEQFKKK